MRAFGGLCRLRELGMCIVGGRRMGLWMRRRVRGLLGMVWNFDWNWNWMGLAMFWNLNFQSFWNLNFQMFWNLNFQSFWNLHLNLNSDSCS